LYVTPPPKSVLPYFCQQLVLSSELTIVSYYINTYYNVLHRLMLSGIYYSVQ